MIQTHRVLHHEVMLRLRLLHPDCIVVPIPNGTFIPANTDKERELVKKIIARMKAEGQLLPGAADLLCLWRDGCGAIELKTPAARRLFGTQPEGRPSDTQIEFANLCAQRGVRHVYATSWDEVRIALCDWGRLP